MAEVGVSKQVFYAADLRDPPVGLSTYHRIKPLVCYPHIVFDTLAIRVGESIIREAPAYTEAANCLALTYIRRKKYPRGQNSHEGVIFGSPTSPGVLRMVKSPDA